MIKESKTKLLINNILFFGFGGVIDKAIPFIMLPIFTRYIPDEEIFGFADIFSVTIGFGAAALGLGVYSGMFRTVFNEDNINYRQSVVNTSLTVLVFIGSLAFGIFLLFHNSLALYLFGSNELAYLILTGFIGVAIFLSLITPVVGSPLRIVNNRKDYVGITIIGSLMGYFGAAILLVLEFYLFVIPAVILISSFTKALLYFLKSHNWFRFSYSLILFKDILSVGLPMAPIFLMYWGFSAIDRIAILYFLDFSELGIYSVSNKLAMVSTLIYIGFQQGWPYFNYSLMNEKSHKKTVSSVFEYLFVFIVLCYFIIVPFIPLIFEMFLGEKYLKGNSCFYYLFLSPLALMLFQVISSQFTVIKNTKFIPLFLVFGLLVNLIGNYFLIPFLGIEGAAISTFLGYVVSIIVAVIVARKFDLVVFTKNTLFIFLSVITSFLLLRVWRGNFFISAMISTVMIGITLTLYNRDIHKVYLLLKKNYGKNE